MFNECFWKPDEKLLIFTSLISLYYFSNEMILDQAFDTVFHYQIKHQPRSQVLSPTRRETP